MIRDKPLNRSIELKKRFAQIRTLASETERLAALARLDEK
jgi:hypothetical protein